MVDNGLPQQQDIATVNIQVQRNLNAPYFTERTYNFVAFEDDPIGTAIGSRLQGADDDRLVRILLTLLSLYQTR